MKLRILESKYILNGLAKEVFDEISRALKDIGFDSELDSCDIVSFLSVIDILASNSDGEFVSMQIMVDDGSNEGTSNLEPFSVSFKHSMKYSRKKRFDSIDSMVDYIITVASESEARTSYDTKNIKKRKQLLCQDCIDSLRGISGKRVTVLKDADIPKRRIFISDSSYTNGEEVCKCDRCKNVYPVDWIHVCTIN